MSAPSTAPTPAPTPAPTSRAATPPPATVSPACEPGDVPRIIDLGLGRGLDATNSTPWLNKTSFQVRRVCFDELVGTDEGGALQSYANEINSVSTQQVKMKSSVTVPQSPVTIGVDAEMSRSSTSSRRSVGKKVINRTISYREDMDDLPLKATGDNTKEVAEMILSKPHQGSVMPPFEERLATWICKTLPKPRHEADASALDHLTDVIDNGTKEDRAKIIDGCREFVSHFRITHYVSAIELGAAEYVVMSSQQFQTKVSIEGKLGVDKIASNSVSSEITSKRTNKSSNTKKIGCINPDGTVTRRTYGEAVVGVKMQPISRLVNKKFLQLSLQLALVEFIEDQTDNIDGPFIVSCNNGNLFLTVNPDDSSVLVTEDIKNSSAFYIFQPEDRDIQNEFLVGHYRQNAGSRQSAARCGEKRIVSYLEAPVSFLGYNDGPLKVKQNVKEEYCRFMLHDRLLKNLTPTIEVSDWVNGSDAYYINCSRRKFARDGYVAVKKVPGRAPDQPTRYITGCFPSIDYHSDDHDVFMLFQLLRPSLKQLSESRSQQIKDIIAKLMNLTGKEIAGLEPESQI